MKQNPEGRFRKEEVPLLTTVEMELFQGKRGISKKSGESSKRGIQKRGDACHT